MSSVAILVAGWMLGMGGCSSGQVVKAPDPLPEEPPPFVQVPHPAGFDMGDVRAIFNEKTAPDLKTNKFCDEDFRHLLKMTQSREEIREGAREFVRKDPVKYHWCFYTKILELEAGLQGDGYIQERQKRVLETYEFLVPIAHGFHDEYHDSRYLRWAIQRYRRLSEWVFFRKVEASPQTTLELSVIENPFALWRQSPDDHKPVLEKYGLSERAPAAAPVEAPAAPAPAPEKKKTKTKAAPPEEKAPETETEETPEAATETAPEKTQEKAAAEPAAPTAEPAREPAQAAAPAQAPEAAPKADTFEATEGPLVPPVDAAGTNAK